MRGRTRGRLLTALGIALLMVSMMAQTIPDPAQGLDPAVEDFWQYDYKGSNSDGVTVVGTLTDSVKSLETRTVGGIETAVYVLGMTTVGSIGGSYLGLPLKGSLAGSGVTTRIASDSRLVEERVVVNMDVVLAGYIHDSPSGGRIAAYNPPLADFPVDQTLVVGNTRVSTSLVTGFAWTEFMRSNQTEMLNDSVTATLRVLEEHVQVTTKAGSFDCFKLEIDQMTGNKNSSIVGYYSLTAGNFVKREGADILQGFSGEMTLKSYRYSGPFDRIPPVADAGPGKVAAQGASVILDASESYDNVGIDNFTWTYADNGSITEKYGMIIWVILWDLGNHTVELRVADGAGLSAIDITWISVIAAQDNMPVADAGPDMQASFGDTVLLDGSGSTDDFGVVNYTWTFVGLGTKLYGQTPSYILLELGIVTVNLVVSDTSGQKSVPDYLNITVFDLSPPVAEAGPGRAAAVGREVILDASGSTDNVGIVNFTWSFVDHMEVVHVYDMISPVMFQTSGNYSIELKVTDAVGLWDIDSTWIDVIDIPDLPPTANAGQDQTVAQGLSVTLNGSASTDDFGIANYTWTIAETGVVAYGPNPQVVIAWVGVFRVDLVVVDTVGQISPPDEMKVYIVDTTPPIADAGSDLLVDFGDVVVFDGEKSQDNVGITSYEWIFDDGDSVSLGGMVARHVFNSTGIHVVTLKVADDAGMMDYDVLVVTVVDADSPIAKAGPDMTVFVGDVVILNASESTDNVGIVSYTWVFADDTSHQILGKRTQFVASDEGVFTIVLTASDAQGNTGHDDIVITVRKKASMEGSYDPMTFAPLVVVIALALAIAVILLRRRSSDRPDELEADETGEEPPPPHG